MGSKERVEGMRGERQEKDAGGWGGMKVWMRSKNLILCRQGTTGCDGE